MVVFAMLKSGSAKERFGYAVVNLAALWRSMGVLEYYGRVVVILPRCGAVRLRFDRFGRFVN